MRRAFLVLGPGRARRAGWLAAGLIAAFALAGPSLAQWGRGSLFTETGVEISVDGRIVSLYGMLNGLGYDIETVRGPHPLLKPQYTEAREKARSSLGRPGPGLNRFEAIIGKVEWPAPLYAEAVLELGPPPSFKPSGKVGRLTAALYKPVRAWFNEEGGVGIFQQVASASKSEQRKLLGKLNKSTEKLRDAIRLGDEEDQLLDDTGPKGRVILTYNPLDAHGTLQRVQLGPTTYIVAGPFADEEQRQAAVDATLLAYARTLVNQEASKAVSSAGGLPKEIFGGLGKSAKKALQNPSQLGAELLACAALKAVHPGSPCAGSPLEGEAAVTEAQTLVDERMKIWLAGSGLLQESAPELLAKPAPPPPPPAAAVDGGPVPVEGAVAEEGAQ